MFFKRFLFFVGVVLASGWGCAQGPLRGAAGAAAYKGAAVEVDWARIQVIEVLDGDTFVIDLPQLPPLFGERLSVRVRGIETASLYGRAPCEKQMAQRAKQELETLLEQANYQVTLVDPQRGKFFRIVSSVEIAGRDLTQHLLEKALGVEYGGGTKPEIDWCNLGPG